MDNYTARAPYGLNVISIKSTQVRLMELLKDDLNLVDIDNPLAWEIDDIDIEDGDITFVYRRKAI